MWTGISEFFKVIKIHNHYNVYMFHASMSIGWMVFICISCEINSSIFFSRCHVQALISSVKIRNAYSTRGYVMVKMIVVMALMKIM